MSERVVYKRRNFGCGTLFVLLVCAVVLVIAARFSGFMSVFPKFKSHDPVVETRVSVDDIKRIQELTTATYYGESLEHFAKEGKYTDGKMVAVVRVSIRYGIDFSEMEEDDLIVDEDGNVTVFLPHYKELDRIVNPSDFKYVYTKNEKLFTRDDEQVMIEFAKERVLFDALDGDGDIISKASAQGIKVMKEFFIALGFDEDKINISYK